LDALTNFGRGNVAGDGRQKVDSGFAKNNLMGVRGGGAAELFRRYHKAQRVETGAGTAGDDEIARVEKRFVALPRGDFEKLIGCHNEVKMIFGVFAAEAADSVDCVENVAGAFERRFGYRWNEVPVIRARESDHRISMQKRSEIPLGLVRRA